MEVKSGSYYQDKESSMVYLVTAMTSQTVVFLYADESRKSELAKGRALETSTSLDDFKAKYVEYVEKVIPTKIILHSHLMRRKDGTFYQTGWKSLIELKDYDGESLHVLKKEIILG